MPKSTESLNRSLFDLLRTKGYNPTIMDTSGKEIPVPEEAEVFQFDFIKDEINYGKVTISIDGLQKLTIYFNDDVANSDKGTDSESRGSDWYSLLKQLKKFATHRQLSFDLKNSSHLKHDMAKREYMKNKEKISEGYYPMGKKASYSDAIPSVKIVIEHTRQLEEGEARFRSINRIFLENQQGERFLLNTKKPGIARVYARHIAEGGKINDQRWDHIGNLVEEYSKMSGFVRATKNGQFNESAQQLVNEGLQHYQKLRETLSRMTGHRGYNTYFESWTPSLMEDEADTSNINELFVQETLDPRIESVMPILSKLHKQVAEMKEVSELSEWADSLLEGGDGGEASEEPVEPMTDEEDLDEGLGDVAKKVGGAIKKAAGKAMDVVAPGDEELLRQLQKSAGVRGGSHGKPSMAHSEVEKRVDEEEIEESGLQAYLGNKKYGEKGMDALRKAGREHASKEKMAQIRAKYDKLDEEGVAEDQINEAYIYTTDDAVNVLANLRKISKNIEIGNPYKGNLANEYVNDVWSVYTWLENTDANMYDPKLKPILADVFDLRKKAKSLETQPNSGQNTQLANQIVNTLYPLMQWIQMNVKSDRKGMAEDLDANQKRVGQLGPTEKVGPKGAVGKLVGANESFINTTAQAVTTEEDVAEGTMTLDEGVIEKITALAKKIPGIGKYYQMAQELKPQLIQILKTSKSGKEVKQKMEQLVAQQQTPVAEAAWLKQLGGMGLGGASILSAMWMNAMGMIDGVLSHAAAGETGGAIASGSILGLIPVTLMILATMLLFKGSKQGSEEKAQKFQTQRSGMMEGQEDLDAILRIVRR